MKKIFNINDVKSMNEFHQQQAKRKLNFNEISGEVDAIISSIRKDKDSALLSYTNEFDNNQLSQEDLKLDKNILSKSTENISRELLSSLKFAHDRILAYHKKLKPENLSYTDQIDIKIEQRWTPVESVGVYVPGGKAIYPSSVLMNVIPALVAGVRRIVMVTPSMNGVLNNSILAAASICNVEEVYRIGGAQAIAALTYGTDQIDKVDMIVGPGNSYVAAAKKQVFGDVGIDSIAGPSEIMVIADKDSNPEWVAVDLLSQAEHDEDARPILVSDNLEFINSVNKHIQKHLKKLTRKKIATLSLKNNGIAIKIPKISISYKIANLIAPEHLQIISKNSKELTKKINNAGAIFVGSYTPESFGDYVAGPSHVLPTSGNARFESGLSVLDFFKRSSYIEASKESLSSVVSVINNLAEIEGLTAHALSANIRFQKRK